MKHILLGIGATIAALWLIAIVSDINPFIHQQQGVRFCMNGICVLCGLVVGFGWKILDAVKALKNTLMDKEDGQ